jgi:mannose/fructose/N-acetylgalactosamine-specific phosphotransferase system component IIC
MTLLNYILLGIIYFIGSSTSFTFGVGYYTLYRSVFSGLLTGLALGNPGVGLMAGALTNLLFIDFSSTGGSLKGDPCMAGILSAMAAIKFNIMPAAAISMSFPISMIGLVLWKYRLTINSIFIRNLKRTMEKDVEKSVKLNNIYLPQLLLLAISMVVAFATTWFLYKFGSLILDRFPDMEVVLNTTGIMLIILSSASAILWFKHKYNIILFSVAYLVAVYLHFDPYLVLIVILLLSAQKRKTMKMEKYVSKRINKKEIIRSWMVWMNFTHSCYSFEMMQGVAFSHSMIPIFKKLYRGKRDKKDDAIKRHLEFFNTEPNVGSAIHGYIIQMEDRMLDDRQISGGVITEYKKGLMGAVAGMGDFTTQTVMAPITILGMIYGVVSGELSMFVFSTVVMVGTVLFLSLKGFFDGFYYGEDGVIRRVNLPNEIKIFKYSHKIFVVLLGLVAGESIFTILSSMGISAITGGSAILILLFIIFNYILRKGIELRLLVLSIYILNIIFLIVR